MLVRHFKFLCDDTEPMKLYTPPTGMSLSKPREIMMKDKEDWRVTIHEITKSRTRLND